jgi:CheY-like chemotaxis protein
VTSEDFTIPKRRVDLVPVVLVVDDLLEDRGALQRGAQAAIDALDDRVKTGRVETADDLESAISRLTQQHFDVVVTDLQLTPEKGNEGWDVLQYARKINAETKVIIVTAYPTPEVEARSMALGAFSYVDKLKTDLVNQTMRAVLDALKARNLST